MFKSWFGWTFVVGLDVDLASAGYAVGRCLISFLMNSIVQAIPHFLPTPSLTLTLAPITKLRSFTCTYSSLSLLNCNSSSSSSLTDPYKDHDPKGKSNRVWLTEALLALTRLWERRKITKKESQKHALADTKREREGGRGGVIVSWYAHLLSLFFLNQNARFFLHSRAFL